MALGLDDIVEDIGVPVVLVGVGLVLAAPFLIATSRPVAKRLVRVYLDLSEKVKESAAETREKWADLLAEVQAERAAIAASEVESVPQSGETAPVA